MEDKEIIKTEDLTFDYTVFDENGEETGKNRILTDIDLSIEKGSFVAVLGHNGSGKSTLAKHFNGILLPTSGKVLVDGIDTTDESRIYDIRQTVGMVFQNPDNQIVATIVEEDVAFALENLGVPPDEIRRRVDEALKTVDMYEYRSHAPHQLSGGQKQRVAIARALAAETKYLLCDEATSALDPDTTRSILELMKKINETMGVTIVVITHEMKVINSICDRVAVLDKSRVAELGAVSEVFANPQSDIARRLVLPESKTTAEVTGGKKIRIIFNGESSTKPVIANMIFECGVPVNILYADTKDLDGKAFGEMIIQLPDDSKGSVRAFEYLKRSGIDYAEI